MKNMKSNVGSFATIALVAVFAFSSAVCFAQTINSPEALKTYLDSQPVNSPDKPIRVTMAANAPILPRILNAINLAGKYVSLNLSGNALTTISDEVDYCETLVGITIPDSVTSIGDMALRNCPNLTAINVGTANTAYSSDQGVLYDKNKTTLIRYPYCKTSNTFIIPNSVTEIGRGAFLLSKLLTSVTIPNSVTSIKESAFHICTSLTSITIPDSVTSIGEIAFLGCTSLTSVTFQGKIDAKNFHVDVEKGIFGTFEQGPFDGDLHKKYLAGGIGTYTRASGSNTWTKQ